MGSGFESQGAHFKENPADSSESAGFLRSLNKYSFVVRGAYILFAPAGDPSSQSSDTLMSRQRIYAPLRVSVFGVCCGPAGVAVDVRWFRVCAPCLANWGGGGLSPFSVLLVGKSGARRGVGAVRSDIRVPEAKRGRAPPPQAVNVAGCGHAKARRNPKGLQRANHTKSLYYRTGQIRVTNSRKSSTSLPCSSRPTPKRVATSALSSNDK